MPRWTPRQESFTTIYNCDPGRPHGCLFGGEEAYVPAHGQMEFPTYVANHILRKDTNNIDLDNRYWLTDDKELFDKCVESFKATKKVTNPKDDHLIAAVVEGTYFVKRLTDVEYAAVVDAHKAKLLAQLLNQDTPKATAKQETSKGKPVSINV